jgi:hypothetical protein
MSVSALHAAMSNDALQVAHVADVRLPARAA